MNEKETISFRATIQPNTSAKFSERVKGSATVESVRCHFYQAQQRALQVRPCVLRTGNKLNDLITYPDGTDAYLSGDNETLPFEISMPVGNDDEITIFVKNIDPDDAYTLVCDVTLDYLGGQARV